MSKVNLKNQYVDSGLSLTTSQAWEGIGNQFELCERPGFTDASSWEHSIDRVIIRYVNTSSIDKQVFSWKSQNLISAFQTVLHEQDEDIRYLKAITDWQKHRLDYQAVYNAYLLEAIDESEFLKEAEKFASMYREVEPSEIVAGIAKISKLVSFSLDLSDYADFFGIEMDAVKAAVDLLPLDIRQSALKYSSIDGVNESVSE